jgi:hypothetical protein
MRSLIRFIGAIAALVLGLAIVFLGRDVQAMGLRWSGGYYSLGNMSEFFVYLGALWLGGGFIALSGFLGFLSAALGLRRPSGGRGLAVTAAVGVALGVALVAGALILRPDHGSERFLTILLAAGAMIFIAFIATASRGRKTALQAGPGR